MVLVEHLARVGEVEAVLAGETPRQAGQPVEVGAGDRRFRRVRVAALEALDLAVELLTRGVGQAALVGLLPPAGDLLGQVVALAELLLDGLELLAQEVLALRLVHLVARLRGDLLLHGEQLHLAPQHVGDLAQARHRVELLEHHLRVGELELEVARHQVGEAARVVEVGDDHHHLGRDGLAQLHRFLQLLAHAAHQCLDLERSLRQRLVGELLDLRLQEGLALGQVDDARAHHALHQDADAAVGQLEHAGDAGDGADVEQVVRLGVLGGAVALRHQHQQPVLGERPVDGLNALLARHRQRQDDEREEHHVAQRQHRQQVGQLRGFVAGGGRGLFGAHLVGSLVCPWVRPWAWPLADSSTSPATASAAAASSAGSATSSTCNSR